MNDDQFLVAEDLYFRYHPEVTVVNRTSLAIARGSFSGLIGSNGSGKSTLLRLLAGILTPAGGRIMLGGVELQDIPPRERATRLAYVPQKQTLVFPFTALEVVLTGRTPYNSRFRFESDSDRMIAFDALAAVGASNLASRPITELSVGEQQLVSVARALAQETEILLLDEPSAALDLKHRAQLLSALRRLRDERELTVLIVTHDLQMLDRSFDYLYGMRDGRVTIQGLPQDVLQNETLALIYEDDRVRTAEIDGQTVVWSEW